MKPLTAGAAIGYRRSAWQGLLSVAGLLALVAMAGEPVATIRWPAVLRQPAAWYAGPEAARIADNVVAWQRASGGWPKNQDMAALLPPEERRRIVGAREQPDSTIDNGATTTQLRFLARVHTAAPHPEVRAALLRGVDYLLDMQYPNGGWPQYWPRPKGYAAHITFNDGAMVNVLNLLSDLAPGRGDFGFADPARRERAGQAVTRGIECILRCQVMVGDRRTVWCAQHHEETLAPAAARSYEHPTLSGAESVGVTRFLLRQEAPGPEVVAAVEAAAAWFTAAQIRGVRVVEQPDPALPKGYDKVVVADAAAPPLWARFYDLRSGQPVFSGRDGVIRTRLADIEYERRVGYAWYTDAPAGLLAKDLPAWRARVRGGASGPERPSPP